MQLSKLSQASFERKFIKHTVANPGKETEDVKYNMWVKENTDCT